MNITSIVKINSNLPNLTMNKNEFFSKELVFNYNY